MFEVIFLVMVGLLWLVFSSVQDLKTREVSNWLSFSLIIFVLGFRLFYSLFFESFASFDNFFYQGLVGLGIFYLVGEFFYHGKLFAGGDTRLMRAMGPVLAFSSSFLTNIKIFALFFILFLLAGSIYGFVWVGVLSCKNFKRFKIQLKKEFVKRKNLFYGVMVLGLVVMAFGFIDSLWLFFGALIFIFPYLYAYTKAVDESCMVKSLPANKLTEGDWLCKDVRVGGELIKADWNGLSSESILLLKKHKKQVLIRHGIPFVPVFLISFLVLILIWFFDIELWKTFW